MNWTIKVNNSDTIVCRLPDDDEPPLMVDDQIFLVDDIVIRITSVDREQHTATAVQIEGP